MKLKKGSRAQGASSNGRPAERRATTSAHRAEGVGPPGALATAGGPSFEGAVDAPARPAAPTDLAPRRTFAAAGAALLAPGVPALLLLIWSLVPRIADVPTLALQVRCAAGLLLLGALVVAARAGGQAERPSISVVVRKVHWLQCMTQSSVYVFWGFYWEPVRRYVPLIVAQVLFVYSFDALWQWWRRRPWVLTFAHVPVILSTNLFMWFRDENFGLQFALVAFAVASKELLRWRRGGVMRHIFNPSSIALATLSAVLLALGRTQMTHGYDIAITQDIPPQIHLALFAIGLIVQLNFEVVLVTMSAAVSLAVVGAAYTAATGVYMFTTTSIPGAVMLGTLLLVTDPATSPDRRVGKVLFGLSYGALVFALFPVLEGFGPFGYFDKLLPVPILNLLVPTFDRAAERLTPALERAWGGLSRHRLGWVTTGRAANFAHVAGWAAVFAVLLATRAVGAEHEGRSVEFWQRSCEQHRSGACERLYAMYDNACDRGVGGACHNLGLVVAEGRVKGVRRAAEAYFAAGCEGGVVESCAWLATRGRSTPAGERALARTLEIFERACQSGEGPACQNLGNAYRDGQGAKPDGKKALAAFRRACELGLVQGCSSAAAFDISTGGPAEKARAVEAFRRACDIGDGAGCANLAVAYGLGAGVQVDLAQSAHFQQKACDAGVGVACARLVDMIKLGQGVAVDLGRASAVQKRACELGVAQACVMR